MSTALSSALSGLETSLQSSIPTDADLRQLEALLIRAHQAKLKASIAAAQHDALAKIAAAHDAAQAQLEARATEAQATASEQISAAVSAQVAAVQATKIAPPTAQESEPEPQKAPVPRASDVPTAHPDGIASNIPNPVSTTQPDTTEQAAPSPESLEQKMNEQPVHEANPPQPVTPVASATAAAKSVNARYANLNAGLNDRLAFVKSLFGGDDHDYQRVVAYLATLESKAECETFIREAVQPEYDWSTCPDVAERFMNLVYARFE